MGGGRGICALHWEYPTPTPVFLRQRLEWHLFPEASLGGLAFRDLGEGSSQFGKMWKTELRGAHPPIPCRWERGVSPLPRENFSRRPRIPPGSTVSFETGREEAELEGRAVGRAGLVTSWGSWPGWPHHRRCSCCGPAGRSPCCPIPRPSWREEKQSLSFWKSPSHLQFPILSRCQLYLFLMIQCLVPFCAP